jgi:uncharacterized protein (TIGR02145 family)
MYNWYTVNTAKLCPTGWHVSTDAEWTTLTDYLGGTNLAGGKLKETGTTHWLSPNTGADNSSGFTAVPGGWRNNGGTFFYLAYAAYIWSATEANAAVARTYAIYYNNAMVGSGANVKVYGYSVRCVRN